MTDNQIQPLKPAEERPDNLEDELARARQRLLAAESELAEEQAAVNAFRMHCRLKLDQLVDTLQSLNAEKQFFLTRWQLLKQESEQPDNADDPLAGGEQAPFAEEEEEEPLLPTDVPRDKAAEKRLYRQLARRFHPDLGQTAVEIAYRTSMMTAVNEAYAGGDIHTLYDLAGELEPAEIARLEAIPSLKTRRLREQILKARRRRRKAIQRLKILRQENTARLWQKAQSLDDNSTNWWELVRQELEQAIHRRQKEVATLKKKVEALESQSEPG